MVIDPIWSRIFALLLGLSTLWIIGDKLADVIKYAISAGYQVELKNDWDIGASPHQQRDYSYSETTATFLRLVRRIKPTHRQAAAVGGFGVVW